MVMIAQQSTICASVERSNLRISHLAAGIECPKPYLSIAEAMQHEEQILLRLKSISRYAQEASR